MYQLSMIVLGNKYIISSMYQISRIVLGKKTIISSMYQLSRIVVGKNLSLVRRISYLGFILLLLFTHTGACFREFK